MRIRMLETVRRASASLYSGQEYNVPAAYGRALIKAGLAVEAARPAKAKAKAKKAKAKDAVTSDHDG